MSFVRAASSMGKIVSQEELVQVTAREKRAGRRVVFTNGCFDLLHPGHVRCLAEARALGDVLVVAINSDRSVRGNKGPERPLVAGERSRRGSGRACLGGLRHDFR